MPRINIEDKLWGDPRFDALKIMLGNEYLAIGYMVKMFKLAQESWLKKEQLIPVEIWDLYNFSPIEKVGLAERLDGGIYVKGSQDNFKWLENKREAGRKSAEIRKIKYGTSQPYLTKTPNSHRTATEHLFEKHRTATEPPTPTPTLNINTYTSNKEDAENMPDGIVNVWNQTLTDVLPKVSRLTDKRRKLINAQLKKYPDIEHWKETFEKVKASDFLTGRSQVWKCGFDWVLNENNRTKVLEGNYENKKSRYKELNELPMNLLGDDNE